MKSLKHRTFIDILGIVVVYTLLLPACTSTSKSTPTSTTPSQEINLEQAVSASPNSANAHYDLGYYRYMNGKRTLATESWERVLELDPNYTVKRTSNLSWNTQTASNFGISRSSNLEFNDFSLNMFLATVYLEMATYTGTDPLRGLGGRDKQSTLENALVLYRRGYEFDITGGRNNSTNLKIVYLGYIGRTLDLLGRTDEANAIYTELSRIENVTDTIASRIGIVVASKTAQTKQENPPSFTANAPNESDFQVEINKEGGYVTIKKYTGTAQTLVIPDKIQGLPVTGIGQSSFTNTRLRSVTIPETVTIIWNTAFYQVSTLTSVTIPKSVKIIGGAAFVGTGLKSVTIPRNALVRYAFGPGVNINYFD